METDHTTEPSEREADPATSSPTARSAAEPIAVEIAEVEEILDHRFARPELLEAAVTHRSFTNERGEGTNYERLEFLGDAVLGLIAGHWLYARFPDRPEGELAKLKSFLVSTRVLSRRAAALGLGDKLRLGVGERRSGGRRKTSILADVLEALVGAIYLDAGLEAARAFIEPILETALAERSRLPSPDAKTSLQEAAQARGWGLPEYRLVRETGPDHEKTFTVECWLKGEQSATAEGPSKKRAEQGAAAIALAALELAGSGA